jgi:hypothetical protein
MPSSFQGFGTTFYGKRDFGRDGSYITTEWMIVGMIPVYPVRSLRVIEGDFHSVAFGTKQTYTVIHELPIQWRQVSFVWGFVLLLLGCVVCGFAIMIHFDLGSRFGTLVLLASGCVPFVVPALLRYRRKRAIGFRIRTWWAQANRVGLLLGIVAIFLGLAIGVLTSH